MDNAKTTSSQATPGSAGQVIIAVLRCRYCNAVVGQVTGQVNITASIQAQCNTCKRSVKWFPARTDK